MIGALYPGQTYPGGTAVQGQVTMVVLPVLTDGALAFQDAWQPARPSLHDLYGGGASPLEVRERPGVVTREYY